MFTPCWSGVRIPQRPHPMSTSYPDAPARDNNVPRWRVGLGLSSPEHPAQAQVLLQVQRLGPGRSRDAEFRQFPVHLLLAEVRVGQAGEGAAQVLAAVDVQ